MIPIPWDTFWTGLAQISIVVVVFIILGTLLRVALDVWKGDPRG